MVIAETFGRLHRFTENTKELIDLNIDMSSFLEYMGVWLNKVEEFDFDAESWREASPYNKHKSNLAKFLDTKNSTKWRDEVEWNKEFIRGLHHGDPLVLSHNDLNQGNVLVEKNGDKISAEFIDYEYGGMNYRGFDLGNYYCEHFLDYTSREWPHFELNRKLFPTQEYVLKSVQTYLAKNQPDYTPSRQALVYLYSISSMTSSHLLWTVWDILQASSDASGLGFLENAITRKEEYDVHKFTLLEILKEVTGHTDGKNIASAVEKFGPVECQDLYAKMKRLHDVMSERSSDAVKFLRQHKTTRAALGLKK